MESALDPYGHINFQNLSHYIQKVPDKRTRIARWTLPLFLERAREIHGDRYDYSVITEGHIKNQKSHVPVICNTCNYQWNPSIGHHINTKRGCPNCSGRVRWTLERVISKGKEIYGDTYDYSQITSDHIHNNYSHIAVKCNICNH